MARDKNSFILYCDIIHTVNKLDDIKAGQLFKFILSYVNDENPSTDDLIINLTFEPIKQALKRDLKKYENVCNRNKNNGLKGGRPKNPEEPKKPTGLITNPEEPKKADIDIVIDIDKDIDINKKKKNIIVISENLKNFNIWLEKNAPRVLQMKIQMTDENLTTLKAKYTIAQITDIMTKMHNYKPLLTKNIDVYLTANNWLSKDIKAKEESKINNRN